MAAPADLPPITTITSTNKEAYITHSAHLLARAFEHDVLERYITLTTDNLPNTTIFPLARHEEHFLSGTRAKVESGAILQESGGWGAVSIW
jgi:hypothetical protein